MYIPYHYHKWKTNRSCYKQEATVKINTIETSHVTFYLDWVACTPPPTPKGRHHTLALFLLKTSTKMRSSLRCVQKGWKGTNDLNT